MNFINLIKFPLLIKFELYQQASVYHLEKVGFWTMLREKNVTLSDNARVSEDISTFWDVLFLHFRDSPLIH